MFRNFHHLNRKERYLSIYIYKSIYKSLRDCEALTRKRMEAGKEAKAAYQKRLSEYHHEQKEKRAAELQKKKAPCWADTADTTHFSSRMWQKRQKTCYSYVMLRVELNGFSFPRDIFP